MGKQLICAKTGEETEGLDRQPYPGALGKKIYESIGKIAWGDWLRHQTMLINEYRLTPIEKKIESFSKQKWKSSFRRGLTKTAEFKEPE